MPWIRKPPLPLGKSGHEQVKLLWKHNRFPIYLMDNHRAAWWCWMQHQRPDQSYRLIHIDHHWDVGPLDDGDMETLRGRREQLERDFALYDALRSDVHQGPIVQSDNYIEPFLELYPRASAVHLHAHEDRGTGGAARLETRYNAQIFSEPFAFFRQMRDLWASEGSDFTDQIINFDIDYAFMDINGPADMVRRFVADDYLTSFFRAVRAQLDQQKVRVVTVALSQDWCGGEASAVRAWLAVAAGLGVRSPLRITTGRRVEFSAAAGR